MPRRKTGGDSLEGALQREEPARRVSVLALASTFVLALASVSVLLYYVPLSAKSLPGALASVYVCTSKASVSVRLY